MSPCATTAMSASTSALSLIPLHPLHVDVYFAVIPRNPSQLDVWQTGYIAAWTDWELLHTSNNTLNIWMHWY